MSSYLGVIQREFRPRIEALRDDMRRRKDPDFFWPNGTQVYCGRQGSGKTISAVKHVTDMKNRYPKAVLVSNLLLTGMEPLHYQNREELRVALLHIDTQKQYVFFQTMHQLELALVNVNNGFKGVMYLIDEIHTYFNALESKNIPMFIFTEISQQRKQRKCIIGTSQLFLRMAKPFREQCDNLIVCSTLAGVITRQTAYDGMSLTQDYDGSLIGNVKKTGWFWHTRKIRSLYDTYQKVVSGAEQYDQNNQPIMQINPKQLKKITVK